MNQYLDILLSITSIIATGFPIVVFLNSNRNKITRAKSGKYANLVLTKENPLDNLSTLKNPQKVFIKGRVIDEKLMEEFKQKAFDRKNYSATLLNFAKYILWEK